MTTPTIPGSFVVQQNDPHGCIHILGPEPQNRYIARIEEGTMKDAILLAASRDMLEALEAMVEDLELRTQALGFTPRSIIYKAATAAIAKATQQP